MRLSFPLLAFFCSSISSSQVWRPRETGSSTENWMADLGVQVRLRVHISERNGASCSYCFEPLHTYNYQRHSLSKRERRDYIDAVHCLRKKPSLYNEITGCKSRYDDFQVLHIKQTFIVHTNVRNRYPSIPFIHSVIMLDLALKVYEGSIPPMAPVVYVDL